jgi:hypothetical protein
MIESWYRWFRRRQGRSSSNKIPQRRHPFMRRLAMERVEDRLLLSAVAKYEFLAEGFVDIREIAGNLTVYGASVDGVLCEAADYHWQNAPAVVHGSSTGGISGLERQAAGRGWDYAVATRIR